MPDHSSNAKSLDADLEHRLCLEIQDQICRGRFSLGHDRSLLLDTTAGDPGKSELVNRLSHFIDFESGGLKLFTVNLAGRPLTFSAAPGWSSALEHGSKGLGGPSLTLKLHYSW